MVYSTSEHCPPVWRGSAHTRLVDNVLKDAMRIVTGCLLPKPADYLPILAGIQSAELRRLHSTYIEDVDDDGERDNKTVEAEVCKKLGDTGFKHFLLH